MGCTMLHKLRIDDPVGCVPTHFFASVWGLIAVGLFAEKDTLENLSEDYGVFKGGSWNKLGVQCLAVVAVGAWAALITFILLALINLVIPLRMPLEMELEGADKWEHGIEAEYFIQSEAFMITKGIENHAMEKEDENHHENYVENNAEQQVRRQNANSDNSNNGIEFKMKHLRIKSSLSRRRHTMSSEMQIKSIKNRSRSFDVESGDHKESILHDIETAPNGINAGENSSHYRKLSVGELDSSPTSTEETNCHDQLNGSVSVIEMSVNKRP
jgi:hypothetical protein